MSPQPGEVWLADLGLAAKTRPVVIVSRFDLDAPRALVIYVPLTTQNRMSRYEVLLPKLPFLDRESVANVQGMGSIPTVGASTRPAFRHSYDEVETVFCLLTQIRFGLWD